MAHRPHLGNNLSRFEYLDSITNANIQAINKILIVEGCSLYLGTAKLYRLNTAVGVIRPVRPTDSSIFSNLVSFSSGGYL